MHDVQSLFEQRTRDNGHSVSPAMCGGQALLPDKKPAIPPAARLLALEAIVTELLSAKPLTRKQLLKVDRHIRSSGPYELADDLAGGLTSVQRDALEFVRAYQRD